jgi:uncharacterized protein with GYD domain
MPKYLLKASYTASGAKGVAANGGSARRDAVARMAESAGGSLEAFYFAFGDTDAYVTLDLPDNEAATAIALAVNSSGAVSLETVALLEPELLDAAAKRSVDYRPAGG